MTRDEFLRMYYDYVVTTKDAAMAEAAGISVDDDEVVVVGMGELGWCLMLKSIASYVQGCVKGYVVWRRGLGRMER